MLTNEQLSFEERKEPHPTNAINPPGSTPHLGEANQTKEAPFIPAAVLVRKTTSELNMNRNDISSYSENFNEDEH